MSCKVVLLASLWNDWFASASITQMPDGSLVVASAPGRYVAWVAAFVVMFLGGGWCWRRGIGGRFAPGVFFASFVLPLIVVPGIATEFVRVSPTALTFQTGFWFSPNTHTIPLAGVVEVVERSEDMAQRGASRQDTFWNFEYQDGQRRLVHLSDLFEANREQVAARLRQVGIRVRRE